MLSFDCYVPFIWGSVFPLSFSNPSNTLHFAAPAHHICIKTFKLLFPDHKQILSRLLKILLLVTEPNYSLKHRPGLCKHLSLQTSNTALPDIQWLLLLSCRDATCTGGTYHSWVHPSVQEWQNKESIHGNRRSWIILASPTSAIHAILFSSCSPSFHVQLAPSALEYIWTHLFVY